MWVGWVVLWLLLLVLVMMSFGGRAGLVGLALSACVRWHVWDNELRVVEGYLGGWECVRVCVCVCVCVYMDVHCNGNTLARNRDQSWAWT